MKDQVLVVIGGSYGIGAHIIDIAKNLELKHIALVVQMVSMLVMLSLLKKHSQKFTQKNTK